MLAVSKAVAVIVMQIQVLGCSVRCCSQGNALLHTKGMQHTMLPSMAA